MIWGSRWDAALRHKLKGQEQSDCTWTAHQPGILNMPVFLGLFFFFKISCCGFLFIFKQYLSSYLYIMLHCLIVCPVRRKHRSCLVVPVDSLELGSVNAFHLLEMSVYSPPSQVATKWTHLILFPWFSLNLFSYIIKSSPIFLRQKGPLQPVSG